VWCLGSVSRKLKKVTVPSQTTKRGMCSGWMRGERVVIFDHSFQNREKIS